MKIVKLSAPFFRGSGGVPVGKRGPEAGGHRCRFTVGALFVLSQYDSENDHHHNGSFNPQWIVPRLIMVQYVQHSRFRVMDHGSLAPVCCPSPSRGCK